MITLFCRRNSHFIPGKFVSVNFSSTFCRLSFALFAREGLSLVDVHCNMTSILSLGRIQNTVAHFIFIVFFQTSCMNGEQGHTKSSEEDEKAFIAKNLFELCTLLFTLLEISRKNFTGTM